MVKYLDPGQFSCSTGAKEKLDNLLALKELELIQAALETEVFIVGGAVRDAVSEKENFDIDLACNLQADEILSRLNKAKINNFPSGIKHGTIGAVINTKHFEISTFRSQAGTSLGKNIEEDLAARDFTLNSMALSLKTGKFYDPKSGLESIKNKTLSCTGDPSLRFKEDPLRILRMIRFSAAQGYKLDTNTFLAAKNLVSSIKNIAIERIQNEFTKIILSDYPAQALELMLDLGLLEIILPEAMASVGFEQNEFHSEDVFKHTLTVVSKTPANLILRLAALFHDLGKPESLGITNNKRHFYNHEYIAGRFAQTALTRLKFSNSDIERTVRLVRLHMRPLDCGPQGVRRLIRELEQDLDLWIALKTADSPPIMADNDFKKLLNEFKAKLEYELEQIKIRDFRKLVINGYDLMKIGYDKGPKLGKIIKCLEDLVLENPEYNTKEYLLKKAQELL